jgi:putative flippase GtrA
METVRQAQKWARGKAARALKVDFIRFGVVGTVGFLLTAGSLRILHGAFGMHITLATLISSEIGLLSNFVFHQNWTYNHVDHNHKPLGVKFLHFHMSSWSGVVLITILESVGVKAFNLNYMVSLVFAAGIAMFWNFFWTKYYIFRGHTPRPLLQPEDVARTDKE